MSRGHPDDPQSPPEGTSGLWVQKEDRRIVDAFRMDWLTVSWESSTPRYPQWPACIAASLWPVYMLIPQTYCIFNCKAQISWFYFFTEKVTSLWSVGAKMYSWEETKAFNNMWRDLNRNYPMLSVKIIFDITQGAHSSKGHPACWEAPVRKGKQTP